MALVIPSAVGYADQAPAPAFMQQLSVGLSVLLMVAYGLGLVFSLKTHRGLFGSTEHAEGDEAPWPLGLALVTLAGVTVLVAPVLVLLSYAIGPTPMSIQLWPGAVVMILISTITAAMVTNSGRSAWFIGALALMVYTIFAMTLYLLPPRSP